MKFFSKKIITQALKVAISGALLWYVFEKVDVRRVASSLMHLPWSVCVAVIVLYVAAMLVDTVTWRLLLPDYAFLKLFVFTLIGGFYSFVLPGQMSGEIAKAYRLGSREGEVARLATAAAIDKITGIIGLALVAFVGMIGGSIHVPYVFRYALAGIGIIMVVILFALKSSHIYEWLLSLIERLSVYRMCGPFASFLRESMVHYRRFSSDTKNVIFNIALGALFQVICVLMNIVLAVHFSIHIPLFDWLWIFSAVSIATFIPISFAGLGVRELSFVGILGLFGVAPQAALSLSFSLFAAQTLFALIGGAFDIAAHIRSTPPASQA
jgi:glycosyltransferase 2 family protein